MAESKVSPISLRIQRVLAYPPERVFDAWTQAATLSRWFAPSDDIASIVHVLEPRVGGSYRIEMKRKDGTSHSVIGRYLEVKRPERLVFTWAWDDRPEDGQTLVTVEFAKSGGGTALTLLHEKFPTEDARTQHNAGWVGCLGRIERVLTAS